MSAGDIGPGIPKEVAFSLAAESRGRMTESLQRALALLDPVGAAAEKAMASAGVDPKVAGLVSLMIPGFKGRKAAKGLEGLSEAALDHIKRSSFRERTDRVEALMRMDDMDDIRRSGGLKDSLRPGLLTRVMNSFRRVGPEQQALRNRVGRTDHIDRLSRTAEGREQLLAESRRRR